MHFNVRHEHRQPARSEDESPLAFEVMGAVWAWRIWSMLAWHDIRLRYRRSVIGPFWMTLSMAVLITVLGIIYSKLFNIEIRTYLPYLALGFIVWGFIASTVNESCAAFQEGEGIIRQIRVPYLVFVFRVVWRNVIVLMHTLVLIVPIVLIFGVPVRLSTLLVFPGLLILIANQVWLGLVLGIFSTRFRDIPQVVATGLQIAIFATPIMWPVSALGEHAYIAQFNPLYHLIEIVRAPLLGDVPHHLSWAVSIGMVLFGNALALSVMRATVRRLIYWL
jgi:ABC-type polysaccharide/polyol phosphate export permease